jgi:hypothetical protein
VTIATLKDSYMARQLITRMARRLDRWTLEAFNPVAVRRKR